jgi:predicted TIM-barrel fold metal-dependent hydrolase
MKTPWGEMRVSDAHLHFFSHHFFSTLAAAGKMNLETLRSILGWALPPADPGDLAAVWVEELERHGVARSALIASLPGDEDSVAAALARYPGRFYGYFMLDPTEKEAVGRVRRALEAGLQGICLFPAMHRYSMADEHLHTIFEIAAAHPGTVIFVHCGVLTVGVRNKLGLPSPFDMRFSNPTDLHAVALRHPQVPFVIPHFGAGFFREALMVCDLCPNVHLDTSSSNSWMKYQPEDLDLRKVFRKALAVAGPRRLLFGTDSSFFPRGWHAQVFEAQARALWELGTAEPDAALMLGGNLDRLMQRSTRHAQNS